MAKKLIIGCGTGRVGTVTLATLLNMQPGSKVTHERFSYHMHWKKPLPKCRQIKAGYNSHVGAGLYGDVALQHGAAVDWWMKEGAKVVVMKRDIEGWNKSWRAKAGRRNNWQPPGEGGTPGRSRWYHGFPKFAGLASRHEALQAYYKYYYEELAPAWLEKYPDQVLVFYVQGFNSEAGQRNLLDFCGVPRADQVIKVGLKKNRKAS